MDALTLDQLELFLAVVDEGSFSGAAKKLRRAQSAVTYGVQKLEMQTGMPLFDRSAYRPTLTEAGRVLLLRARRVIAETHGFREAARGLASGLEAELGIVVDPMFPMGPLGEALKALTEKFPTVAPRVYAQSLGAAAELLLDGTCVLGLFQVMFAELPALKAFNLLTVDLVPVAAPGHPLAGIEGPIETLDLQRHVQLVLTDRSSMTAGRDFGVISGQTWRLADLGVKHAMLLAGLGWGRMPVHLVADDIERGRLTVLRPAALEAGASRLVMGAVYRVDQRPGPAGQWMIENLVSLARR